MLNAEDDRPNALIGVWRLSFAAAFVVLATMNAAGYRFAASDQAFYIPAILRHLDPALFPRDGAMIESQAKLTAVDEIVGGVVRLTGLSLPHLFVVLYVGSLLLLVLAAVRIGARFYRSRWSIVALGAALTLRHAIAKTGANSLEGYFHPRQLAFALGLLAVTFLLDRRPWIVVALLACAAVLHPTTAMWFVAWIGVAAVVAAPRARGPVAAAAAVAVVLGAAAVWQGPLAGRLVRMDAEWLGVIADRDYLFPLAWPIDAWITNLLCLPVIVYGWRARRHAGLTVPGETPLVAGALALFAIFLVWLPFDAAHVALAVQLQVSRVFWLLDVFATIYLVWWVAERTHARPRRGPRAAAIVLLVLSLARGVYTCFVQFPDRRIFAVHLAHADWSDAMAFARTTGPGTGWLADPLHAALYGSSLRAAGQRDVLIEPLKDRAIAMYDRDIAMRVAAREQALATFPWDTPDGARALARRFDLDFLVIPRELPLPLVHRSGSLFIYRIR